MRIVFIGTVQFSMAALKKLISLDTEVVGVITKTDSPINNDFADLTSVCSRHEIPCSQVQNVNSQENLSWIESLQPDVIFCFGWSSLIKKPLLEIAPLGVVGYHPAELPQNRGRHPLIWALALGLHKTASTFFFMDEGADSGDILSQRLVSISYEDNARTLYDKVTQTALKQIEDYLPWLKKGNYPKIPQDHSLSNTWRKRGKPDGRIDFRMNSRTVYNLVRALTKPYIGAHVEYNGLDVKVWQATEEFVNLPNIEPGKVLKIQDNIPLVKCADNAIWLKNHEFQSLPEIGQYL